MNIPNLPNAYENIKNACDEKLHVLYPVNIPTMVTDRYEKELLYLKDSEYIDDFEIFRLLSNEALKCSQCLSIRGLTAGSFIIYLLGYGRFNPLNAHYYCPDCGYFEITKTKLFGIDLPEITCPQCGRALLGDGFNLPIESVWGTNGQKNITFDYNVCDEFRPFAKNLLTNLYPQNAIVNCGILRRLTQGKHFDPNNVEMVHGGFIILPAGQTIDDYPSILTYLEDGEPCLSSYAHVMARNNLKRIVLLPSNEMEYLLALQRKTGIYSFELGIQDLRGIKHYDLINSRSLDSEEEYYLSVLNAKSYYEMASLRAMAHNSYVGIDYTNPNRNEQVYTKIIHTPEFQDFPCYTREDFFDELISSGCTTKDAFEISEFIRKGKASHQPEFDNFSIPDNLKAVAKKYSFLFPKAHVVEYTLLSAKLAYYMKQNSQIYSKVVFKQKNNPNNNGRT